MIEKVHDVHRHVVRGALTFAGALALGLAVGGVTNASAASSVNPVMSSTGTLAQQQATMEAKDFTVAYGSDWYKQMYNGITKLLDANGKAVDPAAANVDVSLVDAKYKPADKVDTKDAGAVYTVTYAYQGISKQVKVTVGSRLTVKDFTVDYGSDWYKQMYNGITALLDVDGKTIDPAAANVDVSLTDANYKHADKVDTKDAGAAYTVTYAYDGLSEQAKVTVGQKPTPAPTPNNGGTVINGTGTNSTSTNSSSTSSSTNNATTSTTPTTNSSNNSVTTPSQTNKAAASTGTVTKGSVVYAVKPVYLYKTANFKKTQRLATYPKAKRVNRPMFVVLGTKRASNGALRYKVRDVNHGKKTANKVGYITANSKYVVSVYYQTMPKNKKVTVISTKGVHAYKNTNLTGKAKTYKKGTRLTVKKIVKHNLTTRYQLSNGYYMTANKKLVIQGNY
ncbi:hypothetical protein YK48G_18780 [Lentilactobacillus fungorum]|uniref:DUF5776 domain-containing protein n=1 Tax=Lentilactobacillus fungorum TaxID=2201250 RepID=A0ABQ3W1F0_9LACO|nr:DUF5776 domain-containing protein [Lentilactobacillus fungorum]GHP14453.1 hypothetical protein YK48G_18780 [Lentilactobacillus fungorum]